MTEPGLRVDFYVLSSSDETARFHYAARLAEKGFVNGLDVEVICPTDRIAEQLDNVFWEFQPESFLPHSTGGDSPITLCTVATSPKSSAFVINISSQAAEPGPSTQRIAEIVIQKPEILQATRMHYSYYKKMGFQVVTHKMN